MDLNLNDGGMIDMVPRFSQRLSDAQAQKFATINAGTGSSKPVGNNRSSYNFRNARNSVDTGDYATQQSLKMTEFMKLNPSM